MYSIVLYSLFILFWIAIIYDFFSKPKNEDDQQWGDFSFLRKLARFFWVSWIILVLIYTFIVSFILT